MHTSAKFLFALSIGMLSWGSVCVAQEYEFKGGFPTPETVQKAYDDAYLSRAIEAYKFFYPTVSIVGTWTGNIHAGMIPNKVLLLMRGSPAQVVFTPNSDTPYAGGTIDLAAVRWSSSCHPDR
jgi:hypothetical protein